MFGNIAAALGNQKAGSMLTGGSSPSATGTNMMAASAPAGNLFGLLGAQNRASSGGIGFLGQGMTGAQSNPASPFFSGGFTGTGSPFVFNKGPQIGYGPGMLAPDWQQHIPPIPPQLANIPGIAAWWNSAAANTQGQAQGGAFGGATPQMPQQQPINAPLPMRAMPPQPYAGPPQATSWQPNNLTPRQGGLLGFFNNQPRAPMAQPPRPQMQTDPGSMVNMGNFRPMPYLGRIGAGQMY